MKDKLGRILLAIIVCFFVLFFSFNSLHSDPTKLHNETETSDSENGIFYILNTSSKKIHKSDCGTAWLINKRNRHIYYGDIYELFDVGYTPCGNCFN